MDYSVKIYQRALVCPFSKAADQWGAFGNMSGGYGLRITSDLLIPSVENLYQAMRFTEHPEIQREVIGQKQGFGAKLCSKKYRKTHTRADFEDRKVEIMRWCLRLKLASHPIRFGQALQQTGTRDIVEESKKDEFWGAKPQADGSLQGQNVLGQLLMELREYRRNCLDQGNEDFKMVIPPDIEQFTLVGNAIPIIDKRSQIAVATQVDLFSGA